MPLKKRKPGEHINSVTEIRSLPGSLGVFQPDPQCWGEGRVLRPVVWKQDKPDFYLESLRISQGGGEPCLHPKEEIFRVFVVVVVCASQGS